MAAVLWVLKIIHLSFQGKKHEVASESRNHNEVRRLYALVQPDSTNHAVFCIQGVRRILFQHLTCFADLPSQPSIV